MFLPLAMPVWITCAGGAVIGVLLGSFVANLTARWPQRRSVLRGRSLCESCGHTLRPGELVPIVSFAVQHGRCRHCAALIGARYPLIEGVCGLVAASAGLAPLPLFPIGLLLGALLLTLAVLDLEHFWLPDRLTVPLLLLGLGVSATGWGPPLRDAAIGAAAGYLLLRWLGAAYRRLRKRSGLGGGDPKLLGALGAWLGWTALPLLLLIASGLGLLAALVAATRGRRMTAATRLPFGALLATAAWPLWLWTALGGEALLSR